MQIDRDTKLFIADYSSSSKDEQIKREGKCVLYKFQLLLLIKVMHTYNIMYIGYKAIETFDSLLISLFIAIYNNI